MTMLPEDLERPLKLPDVLPILPLEETVVFPYIIVPLSVDTEKSILAIDHALSDHRLVLLVGQKQSTEEDPTPDQLHSIGSVGMIMRMLKLPDGRIRILVQGLARAEIEKVNQTEPFLQARIRALAVAEEPPLDIEAEALVRSVRENLEKALHMGKNISPEVMVVAANLDDVGRLADLAASNLELRSADAQVILETLPPMQRLSAVNEHLHREIDLLRMQHEISNQAQEEIDRSQREYFLRQQLKAIQDELGDGDDHKEDIASYQRLAKEKELPDEAREEMARQIRRLERSHPDSAETNVVRTYLDWLTSLPWSRVSEDQLDLDHAQQVLDEDHFDLAKVKERILELLAVRQLKTETKGPILCFVGPPGVGKTSLGRSIARALGRQFVRISLGGVRDEAEIRGHRRTYVGALPGRIIQGLHRAGTSNPVFMLDEIDKIGSDFRGDPSSALLEVLDPEQNSSFRDHYLSVPYDLSRVIFITTANLLDPIQPAFLDRMEVIPLSGYSEEEKLQIARRHLIPKQLEENGIDAEVLRFSEPGMRKIIRGHTRESGLRNLEREVGSICLSRSHGSHSSEWLFRRREAADRTPPPDSETARRKWHRRRSLAFLRARYAQDHSWTHPRIRVAQPRTRGRLDLPKSRNPNRKRAPVVLARHPSSSRKVTRPRQTFFRGDARPRPDRSGYGPRMDCTRWRPSIHRNHRRARGRKAVVDRAPGRSHERIGPSGSFFCQDFCPGQLRLRRILHIA